MDQNQNDNLFHFDQQPGSTPAGAEQPPQPSPDEKTVISSGARAYETPPGYTPPVPPPPYATPPGTAQKPPRPNRTWLIVLIVVLVLLCCCCLGLLAFMYFIGGDWLINQLDFSIAPLLRVLV